MVAAAKAVGGTTGTLAVVVEVVLVLFQAKVAHLILTGLTDLGPLAHVQRVAQAVVLQKATKSTAQVATVGTSVLLVRQGLQ